MKIRYKLTDEDLKTYNNTDWSSDDWKTTSGEGELCDVGWLHCYTDPSLALFLNPIHANFKNPRLLLVEVRGTTKQDKGLKEGWTEMRRVKELPVTYPTITQRVAFGLLCVLQINSDRQFGIWASSWLDGTDRTTKATRAAEAATRTAEAARAAEAAMWAAWAATRAGAAARTAEAATRTAEAAMWAAWAATRAGAAARAAKATESGKALDFKKLAKQAMKVR